MITDFHTHILPGIDDGSASVGESIAMLKAEAAQGISHVVATPHFYPRYQTPEAFLKERSKAEETLRQEMVQHSGLPQVSIGAEVYFFRGISESDCLPLLTINKKDCILLEMPESVWTDSMYSEIEVIYRRWGITPVIAHVDRYISPFRSHKIMDRLANLPVLVQANASFFLKPTTASMAMRLLRQGRIHLLGSDCHNMSTRSPNLGNAIGQIQHRLGDEAIAHISRNQERVFGS